MLSLFSEHPIFDIVSGTLCALGAAILLVEDARDPVGYIAVVVAVYFLVSGAMALARRKRHNARSADVR